MTEAIGCICVALLLCSSVHCDSWDGRRDDVGGGESRHGMRLARVSSSKSPKSSSSKSKSISNVGLASADLRAESFLPLADLCTRPSEVMWAAICACRGLSGKCNKLIGVRSRTDLLLLSGGSLGSPASLMSRHVGELLTVLVRIHVDGRHRHSLVSILVATASLGTASGSQKSSVLTSSKPSS
jgi:hypothetical protein